MAFTTTDLAVIESAILSLVRGDRVVTVQGSDGRSVTYAQADLDKLRALRDSMVAEIGSAAGRRRFVLTSTSKGL